jgi:hypothetical protein
MENARITLMSCPWRHARKYKVPHFAVPVGHSRRASINAPRALALHSITILITLNAGGCYYTIKTQCPVCAVFLLKPRDYNFPIARYHVILAL